MDFLWPVALLLILLAAAQGLFVSFFLLGKQANREENRLLALFLLSLVFIAFMSAFHKSGLIRFFPHFSLLHQPVLYAAGPLFFLSLSVSVKRTVSSLETGLHFLLPLLVLVNFIPFYRLAALAKPGAIALAPQLFHLPYHHYLLLALLSLAAYAGAGCRQLGKAKEKGPAFNYYKMMVWLLACSIVLVAIRYVTVYRVETLYLILCLIGCMVLYTGYYVMMPLPVGAGKRMAEPGENFREAGRLIQRMMEAERLFEKHDLSLEELAGRAGMPPYLASKVINRVFGRSFNEFVNAYRVEAAKKLLTEAPPLKIIGIAYDAGFNSKSSFYEAFRKYTGMTPQAFRELSAVEMTAHEEKLRPDLQSGTAAAAGKPIFG